MKTTTLIRNIKELIDGKIPYSEMTDDEIESVIEYKAEVLANSNLYKEKYNVYTKQMEEMADYSKKQNDRMTALFKQELEKAKKYTEKVLNNG